jgi:methyl-accepting chemotaxis protein
MKWAMNILSQLAAGFGQRSQFARRFVVPQVLILCLAVVLTMTLLFVARAEHNKLQIVQEQKLAEQAIVARSAKMADTLIGYSYWSEAFENAVLAMDPDWADDNFGPFIHDTYKYEYSFVISDDGTTKYASHLNNRAVLDGQALLGAPLKQMLAKVRKMPDTVDAKLVGLGALKGEKVMIAVARILAETEDTDLAAQVGQTPKTYLVFVDQMDADFLGAMGNTYGLSNLTTDASDAGLLPLRAADGQIVGSLNWTPARPGSAVFQNLLPFLLIGLLLIALGGFFVLRSGKAAFAAAEEANEELSAADRLANEQLQIVVADIRAENERLNAQARKSQESIVAIALADRQKAAEQFRKGATEALDRLRQATAALTASSAELRTSSATASHEIRVATGSVESAIRDISQVAPATNTLATLARQTAKNAEGTLQAVEHAKSEARISVEKMSELSQAFEQIDDIASHISAIAGQTNLLSLNATIEAARAGEAGKGFGVVASEVKSLAHRSAELSAMVSSETAKLHERTSGSILAVSNLDTVVGRVVSAADAIAASANEQEEAVYNVEQLVGAVERESGQISRAIATISSVTDASEKTASRVADVADRLNSRTEELEAEVAAFLEFLSQAA